MSNKYEKFDKLGEGTYACVFKGRDKKTGKYVALKEIHIDRDEGTPSTALREITLMKSLRGHPNIVSLEDVLHTDESLTLVFELCKQDLKAFIDSFKPPGSARNTPVQINMPVDIIRDLTYQMLRGVGALHENRIIHRDLKPQNVLLTSDRVLKLGDFGLARGFGVPTNTYSSEVVTLWYRPPDVLLGSKSYGTAIDIWSVGCIMAELFLGYPLFRGRDNKEQIIAIFKIIGTPDKAALEKIVQQAPEIPRPINFVSYPRVPFNKLFKSASPEAIDLLDKLLDPDPMKRISATDAMNHAYFKAPRRRSQFGNGNNYQ